MLLKDEPPGLRRELRQRLLATRLTARFGREKILEWYLNSANYGRLAYGAEAASRLYFAKPAAQLSLAEAAMLAGVAEEPALNPMDSPQAALERQKRIIQDMLRYRMISPDAGIQAVREKLALRSAERPGQGLSLADLQPQVAPAFVQLVLDQLEMRISRDQLERGGLRILTSLDYDLQTQANCAAAARLSQLAAPQTTPASFPTQGDCPAASLLSPLLGEAPPLPGLSAEVVVLDPLSGQVLALVGNPAGLDLPDGTQQSPLAAHPAGTILTPLTYLTAFTRGFGPASLVWDIPPAGIPAAPADLYRGPLRLRTALANDYLAPAQRLLNEVGLENVWRTASQFGLDFPEAAEVQGSAPGAPSGIETGAKPGTTLENDPGAAFRPLDLLEVSRAYGILASQGLLAGRVAGGERWSSPVESTPGQSADGAPLKAPRPAPLLPAVILKVEDTSGQSLLDWSAPQTRPIIGPQLAYLLTDILSDDMARWPSLGQGNPYEIGRPAAVKPGQTPSGESNWAVGYTPQRVIGVWLGPKSASAAGSPETKGRLQAAAAGLWHAVARYAHRNLLETGWQQPPGMLRQVVCDPSGLLPTSDCPNTVTELFVEGSQPTQADNLYRTIQVDRQTGRLATIFTPPDLIENRSYMMPPAEAAVWAQQTGLDTPPLEYDDIPAEVPAWPAARITSPAMFAAVRGKVAVLGTAAGEDFASYRLQAGQGLNPATWYQIGQDSALPVQDGSLGEWDTGSLNGLYALQLLVVHRDQSVQRSTVMVTIDNRPPEIRILTPGEGAEITPPANGKLVLQTEIVDDLGIEQVQFAMDGKPLATLLQEPYAISWVVTPGEHTFKVMAVDLAGNQSEVSVTFRVTPPAAKP
jgi:membrane peptidoglycan carboxypeptidase